MTEYNGVIIEYYDKLKFNNCVLDNNNNCKNNMDNYGNVRYNLIVVLYSV